MAKYKDLVGTSVVDVEGDPDNPIAGQLWYNTTENEYRYLRQFAGSAWSAGGNLNTARQDIGDAGVGPKTAALTVGGKTPSTIGITELYNGTSWTESGDLNTARADSGVSGIQTSAISFGGQDILSDNNKLKLYRSYLFH